LIGMAGFFTVHLMMNTSRPFSDGRTRLEDTPSRVKLIKSP
jgi:hypothetical protein